MAHDIKTIDLNFQGISHAIASYLIPHENGAILVECGPGSTIPTLLEGISALGYSPTDVTHIFLTHIHLDHGGAAGWFARQGSEIYVHHVGAPHLINPERLLNSARRIYQEQMDNLWGEFLPVPEDKIHPLSDEQVIQLGDVQIVALDTPGHAYHHMSFLYKDICFTGDVGGIKITHNGTSQLRLPTPPPEINLPLWKSSIQRLKQLPVKYVAPTHFGVHPNAQDHFNAVLEYLSNLETFLNKTMVNNPTIDEFRERFKQWLLTANKATDKQNEPRWIIPQNAVNPAGMSADGLYRYWNKHVINKS